MADKILPHPLLLSLQGAAESLSLSKRSIERMAYEGRLKTVTIGGRRLVPYSEIQRLARNGEPLAEAIQR